MPNGFVMQRQFAENLFLMQLQPAQNFFIFCFVENLALRDGPRRMQLFSSDTPVQGRWEQTREFAPAISGRVCPSDVFAAGPTWDADSLCSGKRAGSLP